MRHRGAILEAALDRLDQIAAEQARLAAEIRRAAHALGHPMPAGWPLRAADPSPRCDAHRQETLDRAA